MKYLFSLLFLVSFIYLHGQETSTFGSEKPESSHYFGVKLMPSTNGGLVQCAVIRKEANGQKEKARIVTLDQFVREFTGYAQSEANPEGINYSLEYKLFDIPAEVKEKGDDEIEKYMIARTKTTIINMWRLRYKKYPYKSDYDWKGGWAKHSDPNINYLPSDAQFDILETYGMHTFNHFVKGDSLFRLMQDIRDKNWQKNYKESIDSDYEAPTSEGTSETSEPE